MVLHFEIKIIFSKNVEVCEETKTRAKITKTRGTIEELQTELGLPPIESYIISSLIGLFLGDGLLPESVNAFPSGDKFIAKLNKAGFKDSKCFSLTFGVASLYVAIK